MPFVNAILMLLNSFQFRLVVAEMLFSRRFPMRRGMQFLLPVGIALMVSFPELMSLNGKGAFYTAPGFQVLNFNCSFLIVFVLSMLLVLACFKISFNELVFLCAGAYISQNLVYNLDCIVKFLFFPELSSSFGYEAINYFSSSREELVYSGVCIGILAAGYVLIYLVFIRRWNSDHQLYVQRYQMMFFLALTILLLNIVSSAATNAGAFDLYVAVLLAACSVLLLMIQFNIFDLSKERYEREIEKFMTATAMRQEKMSREAVNLINIKAHDLKRSLDAIRSSIGSGDLTQSLAETEQAIQEYNAVIEVDNEALSTILTEKNLLCMKNQIEFSVRADGSALDFMKPMDIYLLFSNAMDNAIERLKKEKVENRIVSLHIFRKEQHTVISLENYCSEPLQFKDGLPQTVKPDKLSHGFGMKSIRAIVEKYHGNLVVQQKDSFFFLQILF